MRVVARGRVMVAVGALLLFVGACGDDAPTAEPPSSPPADSPSDSPSETSPAAEPVTSAVWFIVNTRTGLRLVRELRELPGEDPAREAVEAMIAGPTDPDYTTTWNPDTQVLSVEQDADVVTVDLSAEARTASVGSEGAALMVQQLVHTVTDATDPEAGVELLVDGEPAGELWGAVEWESAERRAEPLEVRSLVQIDTPREGETMTSPVEVAGEAATFEANVLWRILDAAGDEVETGFATAREGMTMSPFEFEVELDPGSYTLEISEDDPSGGEGGEPMTDSRAFLVE
jgi:hypothetical protein